ncbi:aminoacetone oxidase family FAD-binding enzyme [Peptostreptococcus russellii]|uniref:NAD(P)/FAD-dependent oxidoreductase n=1 Tax=Peptostreptococcus russellii TaxID=215200 RepID=UPI0016238F16|nr:aminoacetone oxidase family FAD-binding enzyme [Peptostreptococcus russellii]MBC2577669.1 aminoacetone oxidase family FAD-binding enzyme [Peptostreptococcus russellii]
MKKVAIIGAGAAGSIAAYFAAKSGADVTVYEKNNIIGRKLRITGKGRCNITNASDLEDIISNIYRNGNFMYSALYSFSNDNLMDLFKEYGLKLKIERGNRVFPESDKALDVVLTIEKMLKDAGVKIEFNKKVESIIIEDERIKGIKLGDGKKIFADSVVIATGGVSYPLTGSSGDGYKMAGKAGHNITRLKPALAGLETVQLPRKEMIGLNLRNIGISLYENNKKIYEDFGELEFRNYGIDGPTIKSASCYVEDTQKNTYYIVLDLKAALSEEKLDLRIQRDFKKYMNKNFENALNDLLPKSMIDFVISLSEIDRYKAVHQITKKERRKLLESIKKIRFYIKKIRPIEEAIVTSGGVEVKEINPATMESKKVEGLYFAGEIVDIDAYTGGYNLQAAFSMGYLAGISSSK